MFTIVPRKDISNEFIVDAMTATFGGAQSPDFYRFDFMYAFHDECSIPESFMFCQEITNKHLYIPYGATVPEARGKVSVKNFNIMTDDALTKYSTVTLHVKNTNYAMLKICIQAKFNIIGTRLNEQGQIFVEFHKKTEEN